MYAPPLLPYPEVMIRLFGPFQIHVGDDCYEFPHSSKSLAVFQYMCTYPDHCVGRDALIDALWPDGQATSLRVAVHSLREVLSTINCPSLRVQSVGSSYVLSAPNLRVDTEEFERCAREGLRLEVAGAKSDAIQLYSAAADLHRGEFLPHVSETWAINRRELLRDQYLLILERLAEAALGYGNHFECFSRCCQILRYDPCREAAYRALMKCHAGLRQFSRVRYWYELCLTTLREQLDVEPEPSTTSLYESLTSMRRVNAGVLP